MNNNWKQKLKKSMKRSLAGFLGLALLATSLPLTDPALAQMNHADLTKDKTTIISKEPVKPAKLKEGQTAEQLIANPAQPAIYTLRTDYKVQRGEKYVVDYQPYIASVGEAATQAEKDKVNQTVKLPDLTGYEKPDDDYKIDYKTVKEAANGKGKTGNDINGFRYQANEDFRYKAKANEITIKHVFQDLHDFSKYTNPDGTVGEEGQLITTQNGNTGSTMEVSPLNDNHPNRKGFVPEAPYITMQVPENAENFILEYRYNRAHYDVTFDTKGGTPVPNRTLYYEQTIPTIDDKSIPTKVGSDFLGWMPSITLETTGGKTYSENEIIKDSTDKPILNLAADLKMPASKITFTAVWKDKPKADYAIQFWAEKSDHADDASIMDKYEYMGTRVYKDQDTGMRPDLDKEPVKGIKFPDLDQTRLNKIWNGDKFNRSKDLYLNKFFVYNKDLTAEQNKDPDNARVVKSVSSTGKTVYNIYYDRQVYDLYFTKSNAQPEKNTIYPEIWKYDEKKGEAVMAGGPGNPYHYKARFNEMMYKWPNDAKQTKGFTPGYQSFGWGPNYGEPNWPLHLDTPPYRLNADEFLDMANYDKWGGYVKHIDKGDGTTIDLKWFDFTTLSFGIKQDHPSIPHHMDFWMDGFKPGETIIRYDLVRTKADTAALDYGHRYPIVTGFTPYGYKPMTAWPVIHEGSEENGRVNEDGIDELNDERDEITPNNSGLYYNNQGIKLPIGQLDFIPAFFSDTDEFGDVKEGGQEFKENGYLQFHYKRNKYPLRFNYDPSIIRDDSYFNSKNQLDTFYEFPLKVLSPNLVDSNLDREDREYFKEDPKNFLDNPENLKKLGLTDLVFTDPKDNKLKVKRPEGLSDQMVFKGWALDPAGTKLIWENPKETMPTHPVNLYAKWGEPDYHWKVTFDPDGGTLRTIREDKLTTERKKIQEGDIGQEETKTYPIKEEGDGNKQVFTVIQRQKLVEPNFKPEKKGYDFMGWEVIRYKKNDKGDYTDEIDDSYRKTYKVPELYSFGNDVVSPIYLKAIWVPNQRVDIDVFHYYLDKDYNLDKSIEQNPEPDKLENKRANYMVAATGDRQDDKYLLAPVDELEAHSDKDFYGIYKEYNDRVGLNNSFFQTFRVEPEKIMNTETNQMEENPKAKNNVFKFFYRPFRQREYNVNYIDVQFKGKETEKGAAIIDQEIVKNGNRHYDARNYRQIPGWTLVGDPQQQLFFDVDEETNEFLGINGTGKKEITFYYKDVRVIEVPGDKEPPEGYVRVTFKADKGGSFGKDAEGKDITEINYDVIKGLKSDLLPVPGDPVADDKKEADKYYVTPKTGKKFTKWDEKPLLNKNTLVENETKDFYVFTAKFEWSGLTASGLVKTEAFKDPNNTWTNDFAPTIDQLKAQLVWREKDQAKDLPKGTEIKLYDEAGNELTKDEQVYELVNEKKAADKDEVVRTVNITVKATFKDGKEPQELTIPITVYKNVYEALNKEGDKPKYLSDAEKLPADKGGLKDVTGNYVKVTVRPNRDMDTKDDKVYWVNKNAWVEIPEVASTGDSRFTNWTADKSAQNEEGKENGVFNFAKRHKFIADTIITPVGAADVVEQTDPNKKPDVPDSYVKVIVDKTTNAELGTEEKQTQTFWVNPTKDVTIPVANPTGKSDQEVDIPKLGKKKVNYVFNQWQKVQAGEADDKLTEVKPAVEIDLAKNKYTDKVTVIEASYFERFAATPIVKPIKTEKLDTPEGKEITDKDLIDKITPPENKEIESITVVERPDPSKPGKQEAKVTIKYKDGSTQGSNENPVVIPVEVHKNIIPEAPGGQKPKDALENYVKVTFKAGTGGTVSGDLVYYVSPEVEVDMTDSAKAVTKTPSVGYFVNGEQWTNKDKKALKGTFADPETEFVFKFDKSKDIVEKTGDDVKKPDGYVTVKFIAGDNGKITGGNKTYYVNPDANIKLVDKDKATQGATNELVVPDAKASDNYGFTGWVEEIDYTNPIKGDREYVAHFAIGQVTLTYKAGDGTTGDVPATQSASYGGTVQLASQGTLKKENANFIGWKLDGEDKIYQPGDSVKLEKARTATAQWSTSKHTITFNSKGGSDVPSQAVDHGSTATKPKAPTLDGKVFMGWKENTGDENYFDFNTPITADKTLIAQWQEPVQKIDENATVEEQFIKVTFKRGDHGQLVPDKDKQDQTAETVTYKVAKDYSFDDAVKHGLVVPEIQPAQYFKGKEENNGWDKELKLEGKETTFTAQYELVANLIPVDTKGKTPEEIEQLKKDKPEGTVVVDFKIADPNKTLLDGITFYYVKKDTEVTIDSPAVMAKTKGYTFDGWKNVKFTDDKFTGQFTEDTTITDAVTNILGMTVRFPVTGQNRMDILQLPDGETGKLQVIRGEKTYDLEVTTYTRRRKTYKIFDLSGLPGGCIQSGDMIKYWTEKDGQKSKEFHEVIK
ncbi:MAG: InlB B-repeat-containing protein [Clostridiales bacterium]|nr:InlB B-repeat-containing protein [Clostridiales bacterium]